MLYHPTREETMTTYPHITTADVEAEVRRIAAEHPDRVYEYADEGDGCHYVHSAETGEGISGRATWPEPPPLVPGCIMGVALARLGVPLPDLILGETVQLALVTLGIGGDPSWLADVQLRQDGGVTWSTAVADADLGYVDR